MLIQEKELKVYAKTGSIEKVFAVKFPTDKKNKWQLEFKIKGEKERAILITSMNKPRLFPQVNYLVERVNHWCPNVETLCLEIKIT